MRRQGIKATETGSWIALKVTTTQLALISRAAVDRGVTLRRFILNAAVKEARRLIAEHAGKSSS